MSTVCTVFVLTVQFYHLHVAPKDSHNYLRMDKNLFKSPFLGKRSLNGITGDAATELIACQTALYTLRFTCVSHSGASISNDFSHFLQSFAQVKITVQFYHLRILVSLHKRARACILDKFTWTCVANLRHLRKKNNRNARKIKTHRCQVCYLMWISKKIFKCRDLNRELITFANYLLLY